MDLEFRRRTICFTLLCAFLTASFFNSLKSLALFALSHDYGSQIFLVVPVSIFVLVLRRDRVFSKVSSDFGSAAGMFLIAQALSVVAFSLERHGVQNCLSLKILALLLFGASAFTLCYGVRALRVASFPVLFLLFLIPIPDFLVAKIISFLQIGSAQFAWWIFKLVGVPVMRQGLVFHIPNLDLEIAGECSGIRSSIVLLITTILLGEFWLRSLASRSALVLSIVPIVILKNAVRIVTISLLTVYLNRGFLHGWLHQSGGVVFYMLGLFSLVTLLKGLRTWDLRSIGNSKAAQ